MPTPPDRSRFPLLRHTTRQGVVLAKDTPNFIANRIAHFRTQRDATDARDGPDIEEIDALTGQAVAGRARPLPHHRPRRPRYPRACGSNMTQNVKDNAASCRSRVFPPDARTQVARRQDQGRFL